MPAISRHPGLRHRGYKSRLRAAIGFVDQFTCEWVAASTRKTNRRSDRSGEFSAACKLCTDTGETNHRACMPPQALVKDHEPRTGFAWATALGQSLLRTGDSMRATFSSPELFSNCTWFATV